MMRHKEGRAKTWANPHQQSFVGKEGLGRHSPGWSNGRARPTHT